MKKFLSTALALAMSMSLAVPAMAAEVTTAGNGGDVPVTVEAEGGLTFSVTLPTSMSVYVDKDGKVTTADNLKITNNSAGAVDVKDVAIATAGDWTIVGYDEDFSEYAVDSKNFAINIQTSNKSTGTDPSIAFTGSEFTNAAGQAWMQAGVGIAADTDNNFIDLDYDAKVSMQSQEMAETTIANVTYTVGWYTAA